MSKVFRPSIVRIQSSFPVLSYDPPARAAFVVFVYVPVQNAVETCTIYLLCHVNDRSYGSSLNQPRYSPLERSTMVAPPSFRLTVPVFVPSAGAAAGFSFGQLVGFRLRAPPPPAVISPFRSSRRTP